MEKEEIKFNLDNVVNDPKNKDGFAIAIRLELDKDKTYIYMCIRTDAVSEITLCDSGFVTYQNKVWKIINQSLRYERDYAALTICYEVEGEKE